MPESKDNNQNSPAPQSGENAPNKNVESGFIQEMEKKRRKREQSKETEPEKNDLVEEKTPGALEGEVVAKSPVEEDLDIGLPDHEDSLPPEEENLWDVLEQAGITRGTLFFVLIVVILLIGGGVYFLFGNFEEKSDEPKEPEEEIEIEDSGGIEGSYIFGEEFDEELRPEPIDTWGIVSGIDAAFEIGTQYNPLRSDFVYYMELVRKMHNVYNTDIYKLLDLSTDRRQALDEFLENLYDLIVESEDALESLNTKLIELDNDFEDVVMTRDNYEMAFFNSLDELLGEDAYEELEVFIDLEKDSAEIKAYYNAYKTLGDMLQNSLSFMKPRYDDILVNKEALIKGIRVFDIPSSDIEAVIDIEN
ncbi:hypothetical protein GF354_00715 [Candidatus Peregrinibacteria bacterium]|nr:hypothetical protein [Candidatus Peregrinibacteria bacterium]